MVRLVDNLLARATLWHHWFLAQPLPAFADGTIAHILVGMQVMAGWLASGWGLSGTLVSSAFCRLATAIIGYSDGMLALRARRRGLHGAWPLFTHWLLTAAFILTYVQYLAMSAIYIRIIWAELLALVSNFAAWAGALSQLCALRACGRCW